MEHIQEIKIARQTGFSYLLLAFTGVLGFMIFHPKIFVNANPQKTLENLVSQESTARIRFFLEISIVAAQALTAVWFYKLFSGIKSWAALATAAWGMMNATAILVSAISMGVAIDLAHSEIFSSPEKILGIQILSSVSSKAWLVGGLFFGFWLFPMAYVILDSKRLPAWIGYLLALGGLGYVLSTGMLALGFKNPITDYIIIPASLAEFSLIGYLLIFGIRPSVRSIK
jgi:hypothetical protein